MGSLGSSVKDAYKVLVEITLGPGPLERPNVGEDTSRRGRL